VQDLLLMRHNSQISATAGTAQAGGNGGNIRINSPLIVGVPKENSDITANAFLGNGGNVQISTQGIYGLQFRPRLTPRSDITASSEFGVDGIVEINGPIVDPARGLANLPTDTAPPEVSQVCQPGASQAPSELAITGRGGKTPSPSEPLNSNAGWVDSRPTALDTENHSSLALSAQSPRPTSPPIVEAQGWVYNDKGEVELVAEAPTVTAYNSWSIPATCNQGRNVGKK
jgi:large exoprotein involved in heme utilization and adhesion